MTDNDIKEAAKLVGQIALLKKHLNSKGPFTLSRPVEKNEGDLYGMGRLSPYDIEIGEVSVDIARFAIRQRLTELETRLNALKG